MKKEACSNGEQQEVAGEEEEESINQSHNTENIKSHDNYMVITNTQ